MGEGVLFQKTEAEYGDRYQEDMLSMYQHYIDSADKISDRRHQTNALFISINTVLIAVSADLLSAAANHYLWIAALAGILFSFSWRLLIRQYRSLNTAKFQVAHLIEQQLPLAPYAAEWQMLESGKNSAVHLPLTQVESLVPLIFMLLHSIIVVLSLASWA